MTNAELKKCMTALDVHGDVGSVIKVHTQIIHLFIANTLPDA